MSRPAPPSPATADLLALERSPHVVQHGATYRIVDVGEVVPGLELGPDGRYTQPRGLVEEQTVLTATVSEGRVVAVTATYRSPQTSGKVTLQLDHFGAAPPITVPANAQLVPLCGPVSAQPGIACLRSS